MSCDAQACTDYIMGKLQDYYQTPAWTEQKNAGNILKIFGEAYQEYLEENTELKASWSGAQQPGSPPTPDPKTTMQPEKPKFTKWDLTSATDPDVLVTLISSCMATGKCQPESGFSTPPFQVNNPGVTVAPRVSSFTKEEASSGAVIKKCIIEPTLNGYLGAGKPNPVSGSRGQYVGGTATLTKWS